MAALYCSSFIPDGAHGSADDVQSESIRTHLPTELIKRTGVPHVATSSPSISPSESIMRNSAREAQERLCTYPG